MMFLPKTWRRGGARGACAAAVAFVVGVVAPLGAQTLVYFDVNGATAGSGLAANGTYAWSPGAVWSTSAAGTATPAAWSGSPATAVFSAGSDGGVTFIVNLPDGGVSLGGLTVTQGTPIFTGDTTGFVLGQNAIFDVTGSAYVQSGLSDATGYTLTKAGSGTLVLQAATSYVGTTQVTAGTLAITHAGALGSAAAGTSVAAGATLDLRGVTGVAEGVALNGGTLATSTGTSSLSGNVTLSGPSTVAVTGTQLSVTGTVAGSGALTKSGNGTLVLGAANTYDGATTVAAGTLAITHASALGASASGTTVAAGATLDLRNVTGVAEGVTLGGGTLAASQGSSALAGNVTVAADSTVSVGGTLLTVSGVVDGAGGLTKTGPGSLVLSGANIYTGNTTLSGGTTVVTSATGLGAASAGTTITGGATLEVQAMTGFNENITLSGGFFFPNAGPATYNGVLTMEPTATANSLTITSSLVMANSVVGAGNWSVTGNGSLTLNGPQAFTGALSIGRAVVYINDPLGLGANGPSISTAVTSVGVLDLNNVIGLAENLSLSGTLQVSTGSSSVTGNIAIQSTASRFNVTGTELLVSGALSGPGLLAKSGEGTVLITGANTFTGIFSINGGTAAITQPTGLGSTIGSTRVFTGGTLDLRNVSVGAEPVTLSGGTLATTVGTSSLSGPVTVNSNSTVSVTGSQLSLTGTVGGAAALTKSGSGTLVLGGANTFSGNVSVDAGTLAVTSATGLGATTGGTTVSSGATLDLRNVAVGAEAVTLNGGTLAASSGTSSLAGNVTVSAGSAVSVTGSQLTLSGVVSGSGGLTKSGNGTLVLSGANTYTGTTTVAAGTLTLAAAQVLPASAAVVVASGATLLLTGDQTLASLSGGGTVVIAGGTLTLGGASSIGTLRVSGNAVIDFGGQSFTATNFIIDAGVTLSVSNAFLASQWYTDATMTTLVPREVAGTAPFNQVTVTAWPGSTADTHWDAYDFVTPAPEPAMYGAWLIGAALAGLGVRRWQRFPTCVSQRPGRRGRVHGLNLNRLKMALPKLR